VGLSKIMPKAKSAKGQKIQKLIVTKIFGARDWGNVDPHLKSTLTKVLAEQDLRDDLKNVNQESLIIWGEQDNITPLKSGKVYAARLPNNKFSTFKNGRHGVHHTHTDKIIDELIKFL
jgi:pimeloyl-ACP methyl ester carboxylesterase